jgi:hypothetical protein
MRGALLTCLIVISGPWLAGTDDAGRAGPDRIELLLDAIATAESHNNCRVTGDGGEAAGPYQIHRAYWADGTKFLHVNWSYKQASDPAKAREVVRAYLLHYGQGCDLLEMARIHNGGPNGHKKQCTLEYSRRIARILETASTG